MSAKDIEDLKRKVFYIDRAVTPFLNVQIMKLYELISNLTMKVKELEDKVGSLTGEHSPQEQPTSTSEKQVEKKKKVKKVEVTNDIRTITLE
jgi:hypothetical protein